MGEMALALGTPMAHGTSILGRGKTLVIVRGLDSFFSDPRPKMQLFPTDAMWNNFYRPLLRGGRSGGILEPGRERLAGGAVPCLVCTMRLGRT